MLAAAAIRLSHLEEPETRLLFVRILNVLLVGVGLVLLLRVPPYRNTRVFAACISVAILLPGAAESLARCSNDASVFLWSAATLLTLGRTWSPTKAVAVICLLCVGPLLKLTAFPVVSFALAVLWQETKKRHLVLLGAAASLLVFPLQLLRGWRWGGTYELNRPALALLETVAQTIIGFGRSVYTFVKTTFWLGGWSFFRAPLFLVGAYLALLLIIAVRSRPRLPTRRLAAHVIGLGVAALGFSIFAVANRRFFGVWGGVGGWYAWSWFPWLAVAVYDTRTWRPTALRPLLWSAAAFAGLANLLYYKAAYAIYR